MIKKTELTDTPDELLTKKDLARRLKISTRKIELDTNLPKIVWGRNVRYDWREVLAYLRNGGASN